MSDDYKRTRKARDNSLFMAFANVAGKSFQAALNQILFDKTRTAAINHNNIYYSLNDNPYSILTLTAIDRSRLLIDMDNYNQVIEKTNEEVKKEAVKAVEEALKDVSKKLNT